MKRYIVKRLLLGFTDGHWRKYDYFHRCPPFRRSGFAPCIARCVQEEIQKMKIELGLDKPVPVQYLIFYEELLKGDFGRSTRLSPACP